MENGEWRMENDAAPPCYGRSLNSPFSILHSPFPTAYAPNIAYISAMAHSEQVCIDVEEPYVRQTFRNRCEILTSQGVQRLSIPIEKKSMQSGKIKEVKISYAENWQRQHWRSLQAAYNNSPYFLYYQDDLQNFYEKRYDFLVDFNMDILQFILDKFHIPYSVLRTDSARHHSPFSILHSQFPTYQQVFTSSTFIPNLSSYDLLFNCGPESKSYLCKV